MIKAIIFDLDGTLVNSQPHQYETYKKTFAKHGYSLTKSDWNEWVQNSYGTKEFIEKRKLPLDSKTVRLEKTSIYMKAIKDIELMDGARETVNLLSKKFRLCVASNSSPEDIHAVIQATGLISKFEKLVSSKTVRKGKPFPDVFLKTAELMQVSPNECVVIEDAIAGLKAAKAAGMKCIICPDKNFNISLSEYKDADFIVKNLGEINKLLENA